MTVQNNVLPIWKEHHKTSHEHLIYLYRTVLLYYLILSKNSIILVGNINIIGCENVMVVFVRFLLSCLCLCVYGCVVYTEGFLKLELWRMPPNTSQVHQRLFMVLGHWNIHFQGSQILKACFFFRSVSSHFSLSQAGISELL